MNLKNKCNNVSQSAGKLAVDYENIKFLQKIMKMQKWHYLAVKNLSALSQGIAEKHNGDYYCINCLLLFKRENKLKLRKNVKIMTVVIQRNV